MAEENASDVKAITTEGNPLDITPILNEVNPQDVAPNIREVKSSVITSMLSDEGKDVSEIPEITKRDVKTSRRFLTGIIGATDDKLQVRPRYLGNSVSSCHDLCKYGVKHNSAVKPWKMVGKKKTDMQSKGDDVDKTGDLATGRKNSGIGFKLTPGSKAEMPIKPNNGKKDALAAKKPNISFKSSNSKEIGVIVKCTDGSVSPESGSSGKKGGKVGKSKGIEDSSIDSSVSRKVETKSSKQRGISLRNERKGVISPSVSSSPKLSVKRVLRTSPRNTNEKDVQKKKHGPVNNEDVQEKTLYVVESSVKKKSLKFAQSKAQQGPSSSSSGNKITRRGHNDVGARKGPPSSSPSPKIKGSRTTTLEPQQPTRQSSTSKSTSRRPHSYEHKENSSLNCVSISKIQNNSRPKRSGIKLTPQKMNLRRGKVVESKPEDFTPRRLKFKRRVLQENPNGKGDGQRRNLKNKGPSNAETGDAEAKPEKVVLRHRKVEGKKKLQTLFNNVIEETASKLADAKKSKVKALVGAFETVISLQDNKSSPKVRRHSSISASKG